MFGDLLRAGFNFEGSTVVFDGTFIARGGVFGGVAGGKSIFCDPTNGSDYASGRTPAQAKQTLAAAYALLTANRHDVLYLIGGATSAVIADQLVWSKAYTHLIGIAAPTPNSRARITNSGDSTSTYGLLKVTGDGCSFQNIRIYQGSATAACHALEVTADRCHFRNVTIQGQVHATSAGGASSSLKLDGAEEFLFEQCTIGQTTGAARTAGSVLVLDSSAGKGKFVNCEFQSYSETAALELITPADAAAVDRHILFDNCMFYNFSVNHAVAINELVDTPTSPQTWDLIFKDPVLVGITEIDSTGGVFCTVVGATGAAGTAGVGQSGVGVHPS